MPGLIDDILDENYELKPKINFKQVLEDWQDKNYYEIMGISDPKVSTEELKKQCRTKFMKFALRCSLDKFADDAEKDPDKYRIMTSIFQLVSGARGTLIDEQSRRAYDWKLAKVPVKETPTGDTPAPKQPKTEETPLPKPKIAEGKWFEYCSMPEAQQQQFIINNLGKLEESIFLVKEKKEITPFVFVCRQTKPEQLTALKHLLLQGARIPFLTANDENTAIIKKALNALIVKPSSLDAIEATGILSYQQLVNVLDNYPHMLGYLDRDAKIILLHACISQYDLLLIELVAASLKSISGLGYIYGENDIPADLLTTLMCKATKETSTETLMEILRFLIAKNVTACINGLSDIVDKGELNALKAYLMSGFPLTEGDIRSAIETTKNGEWNRYINSLPKSLINFYLFVDSENGRKGIRPIIFNCFLKKIRSEKDLMDEAYITAVVEYTLNEIVSFLSLGANWEANKNRFQEKLLCYKLPNDVPLVPATTEIAPLLMRTKNKGDYIVHYADEGYGVTCVEDNGQCSTVNLGQHIFIPHGRQRIAITSEELGNALFYLAKQQTQNGSANTAMMQLLAQESVAYAILKEDEQGKSALYYAAQNPHNRTACLRMIELGVTATFQINGFPLAPFSRNPHLPELIQRQEQFSKQKEKVGACLSEAKRCILEMKQDYQRLADETTAEGKLNLAILKGHKVYNVTAHANDTTMACAMLCEEEALVRTLVFAGKAITRTAFKIAILTENKAVIDAAFELTHPDNIPDLTDVMKKCQRTIQEYVALKQKMAQRHTSADEELFNGICIAALEGERLLQQLPVAPAAATEKDGVGCERKQHSF